MTCTRPHNRKQKCFRCPTGIMIFSENELLLYCFKNYHFFMEFLHSQHNIAAADTGTIGVRLAEHKSTWVDRHTSHAIVGVFAKYRRFSLVCYEYSQGSAQISLSRRTGSSCGFSFCNLPSRHRELYFGSHKSHNTTILAQLVAVSSFYNRIMIAFLNMQNVYYT